MEILLVGGPLDNRLVSSDLFNDGDVVLNYEVPRPPSFEFVASATVPYVARDVREAVYRLSAADDESGPVAKYVGTREEAYPPGALVAAMENATDDEILQLIEDTSKLRRNPRKPSSP